MTFSVFVLFFVALIAGAVAFYIPKINTSTYKLWLVFAGSYLFSITIVHIFPDLFAQATQPALLGVCVLIGFFLQQGLEFLSSGVEHGHIHVHEHKHHQELSAVWVLVALCVHAFLEGGMLAHGQSGHHHHTSNTLLWGILLHKAPEAFALMSVLLCDVKSKAKAVLMLMIFAAASPLGLFLSNYLVLNEWLSSQALMILLAIVTGNFLHISTTIVFESSADHKFNAKKMGIAIVAAGIAIATEMLF
ncbi:MAG: ZIP family metal transporter [Bacteroidetes bacterium]|nr:ZIP family metal transporter [Bacteroidota bacterium]